MGATCFKDIVDRDSIKYPKYILEVLDNMMNEDSKMRPSFEIIIEKCYTYLDTIKDTNNMFHLDNLCKKYIALRGVFEGGKLYKKNNINTFNLDNFTPSLLSRIETFYEPEVKIECKNEIYHILDIESEIDREAQSIDYDL